MNYEEYHLRFARDTTEWLLGEFAERHQASQGPPPGEILARLAELRLARGRKRIASPRPAEQIAREPYLLETTVYLLRRQGLWPADPKAALLCYGEILTIILEAAPGLGLPWEVTAEAAAAD